MAELLKYDISVKNLVEHCYLRGDIDNRYTGADRRREGVKIHRYIQNNYGDNDLSEVSVKYTYIDENSGIALTVRGRIDGVLNTPEGVCIEEIKSTVRDASAMTEPAETHYAQCRAYAFIYCSDFSLNSIRLRVTYCALKNKDIKSFDYEFLFDELKSFFSDMCDKYIVYLSQKLLYQKIRDESIEKLSFPFEYRKYQKQIIEKISAVIKQNKNIFINAPTGTGKTLNALYPSVKALPEKADSKVFYLTAKSTQKQVAKEAVRLLSECDLKAKTVIITAKEKACFLEKPSCNPDDCEYARSYYDKIGGTLKELLEKKDSFDFEDIRVEAFERGMCPFELSLDLAGECDIIICDYNYVFDPSAALKRFFEEPKEDSGYIILVDEAHNLTDRSRSMYSAVLSKGDILKVKRITAGSEKALADTLKDINKELLSLKKQCGENDAFLMEAVPDELISALYRFQFAADKYLQKSNARTELYYSVYDMYFGINAFLSIFDIMNDSHRIYYDKKNDELNLFCTNAQEYLKNKLALARACVVFSATLSPLSYFCEVLGGSRDDYLMNVPSVFDEANFKIIVDTSISTSYKKRAMYYREAAMRINAAVKSELGNRLVFFPSYAYMQSVYDEYSAMYPENEILLQQRDLTEAQRADFVAKFTQDSAVTAFVVAGGAFSESIDLTGKRLIGCVICGVSLPMVCTQRELIRKYFEKEDKNGFEYAYVYPGMNKVLQAMGRVIRTATDTGCAVLLDERFAHGAYARCFPPHYNDRIYVKGQAQLEEALEVKFKSD